MPLQEPAASIPGSGAFALNMKILAIETSCDETAVALLHIESEGNTTNLRVLGNALLSQTATHAPLGGVVPSLAKREHARNLVPLLTQVL